MGYLEYACKDSTRKAGKDVIFVPPYKKNPRNEAASLPSLREPIFIRRSRNQSSIVNLQFSIVKNDIDDSHDVRHIDIAVLIDIRIHFIEW